MTNMKEDNQIQAGSEPINPIVTEGDADNLNQPETPEAAAAAEAPAEPDKREAEPQENPEIAKLEKMLAASQKMIGKQSGEIGELRARFEEANKQPEGPSEDEQLQQIYQQMDSGEMDIAEGMRQALEINSKLTAGQVMNQISQQQQQNETAKIQSKFLEENPDYEEVVESGELDKYMKEDPMADEYVAYIRYKADQDKAALQKEYEEKIAAAKEEGAKLAKGAESAGKVLGKQGNSAAAAPQVNRPFKNNREATDAMMAKLKEIRSASAQ